MLRCHGDVFPNTVKSFPHFHPSVVQFSCADFLSHHSDTHRSVFLFASEAIVKRSKDGKVKKMFISRPLPFICKTISRCRPFRSRHHRTCSRRPPRRRRRRPDQNKKTSIILRVDCISSFSCWTKWPNMRLIWFSSNCPSWIGQMFTVVTSGVCSSSSALFMSHLFRSPKFESWRIWIEGHFVNFFAHHRNLKLVTSVTNFSHTHTYSKTYASSFSS